MNRILIILWLCLISLSHVKGQTVGVKTNLLYDATTTFNIGVETTLSPKWTLDLSGNYNPWTFSDNKKLKHILVQPEFRYWFCEAFSGHFLGFHAHSAIYNVAGIELPKIGIIGGAGPDMEKYRYQGWLAGGGISYGYQFYLGRRWNLEATIGVGYAYLDYDQYECGTCGEFVGSSTKNYFGLTKAGISLIYLIK